MLEATSWHDKVFPAAKPRPDLKTWVLAAGLSSRWDLLPNSSTPREEGRDMSGSRQCPSTGLGTHPNRHGSSKGGKEMMGHCGKLSHRTPGSWCGPWGITSGEPDLLLELLPRKYLLCHNTTSTPSSENLFRMANHFYPEKENNQSSA